MNVLEFMCTYMLLTFAGSFFILGWNNITEGYYQVYPDGKVTAAGKIFSWFRLYIEKETGVKKISFSGQQLQDKFDQINKAKPSIGKQLELSKNLLEFYSDNNLEDSLTIIKDLCSCDIDTYEHNGKFWYVLFIAYPRYRFPEWIRNPLISCVECMPSVYGTLVWWVFVLLGDGLFSWTSHPTFAKLVFWIIFIISLSWINKFLTRKTNR